MKANVLLKQEQQPERSPGRPDPNSSVQALQKCYETATFPLAEYFPLIDAWLAEHAPDLWQHIRQEDDELFRLRQLGTPLKMYQAKLNSFISLWEHAERLYCEAQPAQCGFPLLTQGEQVAVYFELSNGALLKVSGERE
jgi:hypothetical protein